MSSERPSEATIFNSARGIADSDERRAYLDEACGTDAKLRERIEKLLSAYAEESQFLEQPAAELQVTLLTGPDAENRAASLEAGLAAAFPAGATVVMGNAGHSVLKAMGQTIDIPLVVLREAADDGRDPIVRPKSPEMPDRTFDSRYQLQGEIARGGIGAILKGRDTDLGRELAIKVLLDQHKDKPEVIQRFIEEAQIGGQLQHPGIAPIYELGQFADKRPFFSMKLVKGETLSKLLADRQDLASDRGRFIGIFEQICQTMAYAHSRGVIHRDLKPANIMVGAFGEVQVMDWGLAKVLPAGGVADEKKAYDKLQGQSIIQTLRTKLGSDVPGTFGTLGSQTQMGSVMGTPAYMPPEQALGEVDHLDERADVFGLGAILCEILTGKPPYVADDGTRVFRMASRGKLEDAFSRLEACGADEDLIALTKHCLKLEPIDRPQDAGVLAERVTGYLESVEAKLRAAEIERAAEAARADAEAAQAHAERQRAEAESQRAESESARAQEERNRRRTSLALAVSVFLLISLGSGGWLYMERQKANRQSAEADAQRQHARAMQDLAEQRETQRKAAELAEGKAKAAEALAVEEKEKARQALARSQTSLAEAAYREFDSPAMFAALESVPEDLRDADWRYLRARAENSQTSIIFPNYGWLVGVTAHPKMPHVFASALQGNTFVFVDSLSGRRVFEFPGTERQQRSTWCRSLDFSPDGTRLIAGALNIGGIAIYDTATGKAVAEWDVPDVEWVRFSPDGTKTLDVNLADELVIRDATNGKPLWNVKSGGHAIFTRTGDVIATSGRSIRLLDGATGALIKTLPELRDYVSFIALSPDGSVIYLGCYDGVVRGQRLDDGAIVFEQRLCDGRRLIRVALSADGRRLLGVASLPGLRRIARVWDTTTGTTLQTLMGGTGKIEGLAIHPLTDEAIVSGPDTRTWALSTRPVESTLPGNYEGSVFGDAEDLFIARGQPARFGSDGHWRFLLLRQPDETVSPSVADAAGPIAAFSKSSGIPVPAAIFRSTADGYTLLHVVQPKATSVRIRLSPDGSRVVIISPDALAEVFDTATGQRVCECDWKVVHAVLGLGWIGANRIVCVGTLNNRGTPLAEEHVFVWDATTGKVLRDVRNPFSADVLAVAPDGRTFAEGGENKRVRIRDTETLDVLREFRAHDGAITALAFHPTQPVLATGSTDLTVRLWNLDDGRLLEEVHPSVTESVKLAFSPRGTRLASTDRGGIVSFFNLAAAPLGKFLRPSSTSSSVETTERVLAAVRPSPQAHVFRGDWKAAATAYRQLLAGQPLNNGELGFEYAAVLLLSGDESDYRQHCAAMLERSGQPGVRPYHVARACTLAPDSVQDAALPGTKAADELKQFGSQFWSLTEQGVLAYRTGRYDEAAAFLEQSLKTDAKPGRAVLNWLWLSLVEHRRGNPAEARNWFDKAATFSEQYPEYRPGLDDDRTGPGLHLHNWLEVQVLRREAESLLIPKM